MIRGKTILMAEIKGVKFTLFFKHSKLKGKVQQGGEVIKSQYQDQIKPPRKSQQGGGKLNKWVKAPQCQPTRGKMDWKMTDFGPPDKKDFSKTNNEGEKP